MLLVYLNVVIPLDAEQVELALHIYDNVLMSLGVIFLLSAAINIPYSIVIKRYKESLDEQLSSHLIDVTPGKKSTSCVC